MLQNRVFCFCVEIRLWSFNFRRLACNSFCVLQLPHCNGCSKVAWRCGCVRNTFVFCSWISYWNGCIKAEIEICHEIFSILALAIFLVKVFEKCASKSSFFCFGVEIRFWSSISDAFARSSILFCNVMAASRLLGAAAACVILLSFRAGHRKSYWSGCIKVAVVIC